MRYSRVSASPARGERAVDRPRRRGRPTRTTAPDWSGARRGPGARSRKRASSARSELAAKSARERIGRSSPKRVCSSGPPTWSTASPTSASLPDLAQPVDETPRDPLHLGIRIGVDQAAKRGHAGGERRDAGVVGARVVHLAATDRGEQVGGRARARRAGTRTRSPWRRSRCRRGCRGGPGRRSGRGGSR